MFTDVYVRYMYYIHGEKSPAESALPDFASLRLLKRLYWDSLAPQAQAEIVRVYQTSQKQAILNYVLINPLNRATLCIPFIPVKTSCSRPTPRLSPEQASSVAQSRSQLIYVQSGYSCRKIRTLWFSEFRNFRFFSKSEAADLEQFKVGQTAALEISRKKIEKDFFYRCQGFMREDKSLPKFPGPMHAAVHALLSQNLRDLVSVSLLEYVNLICSFSVSDFSVSPEELLRSSYNYIVQNKMVLKNGDLRLRFPLDSCASTFFNHFNEILGCINGLQRPTVDNNFLLIRSDLFQLDSSEFVAEFSKLTAAVTKSLEAARIVSEYLRSFSFLLTELPAARALASAVSSPSETAVYINRLRHVRSLLIAVPKIVRCPLVAVDCGDSVENLISKANECMQTVLIAKCDWLRDRNETLAINCEKLEISLKRSVSDERDLVDAVNAINNVSQGELPDLRSFYFLSLEWFHCLDAMNHALNVADLTCMARASLQLTQLQKKLARRQKQLEAEERAILADIEETKSGLQSEVAELGKRVLEISNLSNVAEAVDTFEKIKNLKKFLLLIASGIRDLQDRQGILGMPKTKFLDMATSMTSLEPFENLWQETVSVCDSVPVLNATPALEVDLSQVRERLRSLRAIFSEHRKKFFFRDEDPAVRVTEEILATLASTEKTLPICDCLQDPRITENDWPVISSIVGFPVESGTSYPLSKFVDSGTLDRLADFRDLLTTHKNQEY
jgi:hypothetical protein